MVTIKPIHAQQTLSGCPPGQRNTYTLTCTQKDSCVHRQMCTHLYQCVVNVFNKENESGIEIGLDRQMAWARHTQRERETHPEEQSLSFSWSLHHNPPLPAGNPSCTVLGWSSALLTPWRSGRKAISTSRVHFLFQEHAGRGRLIVNRNGRAGVTHVDRAQSASAIFLDVFEAVFSRCIEKKNTHMLVLMRSTDTWKETGISVYCLFSCLQLQLRGLTALFLRAVDVLLFGGYMPQTK